MKKITILLLLLISGIVQGQSYYNFPDSNTIWNIYIHDVWNNSNTEMKRYGFFEDTIIINSKIYSKLYQIEDDTNCNSSSSTFLYPFREYSFKRVYFLFDTTEILLYDFSVEVGDTIHFDYIFYH